MIGTIVNTCAIVMGTIVGTVLNRGIKEKYKTGLYDALGLASLAIGLNATITNLPKSQYPVLFIVALAIGTVVGTRLDIDGRFHRLVDKTRPQPEVGSEGSPGHSLADGLSTATLLYCIGPLSMLGPSSRHYRATTPSSSPMPRSTSSPPPSSPPPTASA